MSALNDAWQGALAAEQLAAFGYPLLGPQLGGIEHDMAWRCAVAHQTLVDATSATLAAVGATPVPPEADYPSLYPVPDARAARALAVRLETGCAAAWRYLYATAASSSEAAAADRRNDAQFGLTESAVRATRWRAASGAVPTTAPFPGI